MTTAPSFWFHWRVWNDWNASAERRRMVAFLDEKVESVASARCDAFLIWQWRDRPCAAEMRATWPAEYKAAKRAGALGYGIERIEMRRKKATQQRSKAGIALGVKLRRTKATNEFLRAVAAELKEIANVEPVENDPLAPSRGGMR